MLVNYVDDSSAPNERKKDSNIDENSERNNPSFFFLRTEILRNPLPKPASHVAPVPDATQATGEAEFEEPCDVRLREFVKGRMLPTDKPAQVSTAAEVQEQFRKEAAGDVQQCADLLKLALNGFHKTTQAVRDEPEQTTKRVY